MGKDKIKELVDIFKEEGGFLGLELVDNRIRVFVDSSELRQDILNTTSEVDVFVATSMKRKKR